MTTTPPSLRQLEAQLDAHRLRQLSVALVAFGIFGLVTLGLAAIIGLRSFGSVAPLGNSLEAERQQIVTVLHDTGVAVRDAATGTTNAGASLNQARDSSAQAAQLSRSVATTMRAVATASQVSILGAQPLAGLSAGFSDAATQSEKMATTLDSVSAALGANGRDISSVRSDLDRVASEIDQLTATVQSMPPFADALAGAGTLQWAFVLLAIWLLVPALASLGAGTWLWRWLGRHEGLQPARGRRPRSRRWWRRGGARD